MILDRDPLILCGLSERVAERPLSGHVVVVDFMKHLQSPLLRHEVTHRGTFKQGDSEQCYFSGIHADK